MGDAAGRRRIRSECERLVLHRARAADLGARHPGTRPCTSSTSRLDSDEGWAKYNTPLLAARLPRFPGVLLRPMLQLSRTRPRQIEDCVGWETGHRPRDAARRRHRGSLCRAPEPHRASCARGCAARSLVIHGDSDRIRAARARAPRWPRLTGGELVTLEGAGHLPERARPGPDQPAAARVRPCRRRRRARHGGAARQLGARAGALRLLADRPRPRAPRRRDRRRAAHSSVLTCEIDWLAQHPVTTVLEAAASGSIPRARSWRASRAHIDSEAAEHDLHVLRGAAPHGRDPGRQLHGVRRRRRATSPTTCGSATRRGSSTTSCTRTPSCKSRAYVWLTDFVGYLPMPEGGDREAALTADYNAEMIEQIDRFPASATARSSSASPADIVPGDFGPGLPEIREWTERALRASAATSPASIRRRCADREALRARAGLSRRRAGLRRHSRRLGRRRAAAAPGRGVASRRPGGAVPGLRMIVVTGPRIDPATLPSRRRTGGPRRTSTTCTATSPPATWRSSRAA